MSIYAHESFKPMSPKVCPEGTKHIFKFLLPICIDERNQHSKFQTHIYPLQNVQKFPVLCFGPFSGN